MSFTESTEPDWGAISRRRAELMVAEMEERKSPEPEWELMQPNEVGRWSITTSEDGFEFNTIGEEDLDEDQARELYDACVKDGIEGGRGDENLVFVRLEFGGEGVEEWWGIEGVVWAEWVS